MTGRLRYLPALDGLRALAVAGVLCYHAQLSWAPGGFLGVDLFFVLSGFLITTLLLAERRDHGGISLRAFWARRARRLLPALLLVLVGIGFYAAFVAAPDELRQIRGDALSTLGYVANWRFIFGHQSYFQQFSAPSPLLHMWSLAIEEQFYLVWPLIVFFALRARRGSSRGLAAISVTLLGASVAAMAIMYQPGHDPSRVYYGTDTRAQSLLVGALLAILLTKVPGPQRATSRGALQVAGVGAALGLGYIWATVTDKSDQLYQGGLLVEALLVAVVIAAVVQPRRGPLGYALSFAPLRWLGRISYGVYLWHWPIFLALSEDRVGIGGYALFAVRVAVTLATASFSYYFVEMPIRRGELKTKVLLRLAPAAFVSVALVLVLATAGAPAPQVEVSASDLHAPKVEVKDATVQRDPPRVLLVGDSLANSLAPGFQRLADQQGWVLWNASVPGCGLADEGEYWIGIWQTQSDKCKPEWRQRWPAHIATFDPDVVVVLLGGHDTTDRLINGHVIKYDTPEGAQLEASDVRTAVKILSSQGARVVWLTLPYNKQGWAQQVDHDRSGFNERWVDRWNQILRDTIATMPLQARVMELNALVDPSGTWQKSLNGVDIRMPDLIHFNDAGSDLIAQWATPELLALAKTRVRHTEAIEPAA